MKPDLVWSATLQMTQATFDTWLRGARFLKYEDGSFVVGVKNGYAKDWLEHRLLPTIKRTLCRLAGRTADVRFVIWDDRPQDEAPLLNLPDPATAAASALPAAST